MTRWYFPGPSGDFRLERTGDTTCTLTVENPTEGEMVQLRAFLTGARINGWCDAAAGIAPTGKSTLALSTDLLTAGPMLTASTIPEGKVWTAIRSVSGAITLEDGTEIPKPEEAVAAATVAAPQKGCPVPESCQRRASEVLAAFSTKSQWDQWHREGRMVAIGNVTGQAYHVYHQDQAAAERLDRCLVRVHDRHTICVYDRALPAEEQALSLKFAVEHREGWLLDLPSRFEPGELRQEDTIDVQYED